MKRGCFKKNKSGQLKLSFGMIFSIILIILFIVLAFFGIKKFLDTRNLISIETFKKDLQDDIDQMWRSSRGSDDKIYTLPKKIEGICFEDDDYWNLNFIPDNFQGTKLEHIDISKTLNREINPYAKNGKLCFENVNGKITLYLEKDYGESLITIMKK